MADFNYSPEHARAVCDGIMDGIQWSSSKQGADFWCSLHIAFEALSEGDELEFEEHVVEAVKSCKNTRYCSMYYRPDCVKKVKRALLRVFDWEGAPFSDAWNDLSTAFRVLSGDDVEGFNQYVSTFVEKVRG